MEKTDIERLIARIALGDRKAFSELFDATSAKLLSVSYRVLGNRTEAEDAMQETYIKIWHKADSYAVNGLSPMTWLIAIARNTAIDKRRARRVTSDLEPLHDILPDTGPTPEQSAIAASEAGQIAACMEELEEQRRAAVQGAYLNGLTYAELAERFKVPLNTMRTWLRRSLTALRECLSR